LYDENKNDSYFLLEGLLLMKSLLVAPGAVCLLALIASFPTLANEVNVYSYRQPFLITPMFDVFTRETGIEVNVVFAKEGLVERLKREAANSPADLIFTVDIGRLNDLVQADLSQPVSTPKLTARIPAQYRHPDGLWYGLTARARLLVTSKERVQPGALTRYEQLADPEWKGRICSRSGKHVYNVALVASMIAHHGAEEAESWLRGVKENLARKPQGNDRAQVKAIKEGVCDVAVINNYYMGKMLADEEQAQWATAVDLVFPNQEDRGTHVNISGMAMTHSAPNKDNALLLMEFLAGDLAQQMYAEQNFEYPVNPNVPWSGLLKSWGKFKVDPLPLAEVANLRSDAIVLIDKVGFDE